MALLQRRLANSYDINRKVAQSYVQAEQTKGWFLAKARLLVIFLSGSMLFLGVTMLFGHLHFALTWLFFFQLISVAPVAIVAGLLAVIVEGGTVFTSAIFAECLEKTGRELDALQKVAHRFKEEEVAARVKQIMKKRTLPAVLMGAFVLFSLMGAEIFWQIIMTNQEWYFHIIGAILGLVCSALLILLELRADTVERVIEKSISSSAMIELALDQSARAQIFDAVFDEQQHFLAQAETHEVIGTAVERRLHGVLAETVNKGGVNITAEQLKRDIQKQRIERAAAVQYLQSGNEAALQIPETAGASEPVEIKRKSKKRMAVEKAVSKYGAGRVAGDLDKYSSELGMDVRTLQTHLSAIANG